MNEVGFCSVCGAMHQMEDVTNRKCLNCGEHSVYSIEQASDIINDYFMLKADYDKFRALLDEPYDQ